MSRQLKRRAAYIAVVAGCFLLGTVLGWTAPAQRIDHYAYDLMTGFAQTAGEPTEAAVVAIDEDALHAQGGMRHIRTILADALDQLRSVGPRVVALDVILADAGDPAEDARLEASMQATRNLVLPCEIIPASSGPAPAVWEDPLPRFKQWAASLGHDHPEKDRLDGVSRQIPLEETANGQRRWALSLEAFRLNRGQPIVESPGDLQIGNVTIPAPRENGTREMLIRYLPRGMYTVPVMRIAEYSNFLRGKTVFLGVTALGVDRQVNPFGQNLPGVEVHAHAFHTMEGGGFLRPASDSAALAVSILFALGVGLAFALVGGWPSYLIVGLLLVIAHILPIAFFRQGIVFPYFGPVVVAWLTAAGAATFQHFFVRRQLRRSESEKSRYQQAIHWSAHEMRTPLTAIQGSSEIMTRYALPPDKSKQLSEMINSESKRLARLIQTFLDVERLAEGQMELKREPFAAAVLVQQCMERIQPIAERKSIRLFLDSQVEATLTGDRELMEYAFYNLLTNAVKYSPAQTEVHVASEARDGQLRLAVRDQGIGMDAKEMKQIFKKFYRTKRAEASGEAGTGIGLSIVEQIVTHHGGAMQVTSEPGKGSCFTMILKAENSSLPANAETVDRRG